jgi:sulfite oxidase
VIAVELTADDGREWVAARILPQESAWTWCFWEAVLDLPPGRPTLAVRATDSSGTTQPPTIAATWNVKGYCNNAWHRVALVVE